MTERQWNESSAILSTPRRFSAANRQTSVPPLPPLIKGGSGHRCASLTGTRVTSGQLSPWRSLVTCIGLAAAVLAIYGQTLHFKFVNFDDDVHVSENIHVTTGVTLSNLQWDFGIHGPSQWHPLAWLSHQLDCTWFGLNPGGHHLTSVLLHLAASMLLFLTLQRLLANWGIAAFTAAAFAVHPLNVESVAWISERRNVLCAVFCLLTIWSHISYARRPSTLRYAVVLWWHAAALMSKPLAVTLPCVLLLLDFWPLARQRAGSEDGPPATSIGRLVLEKIPLLVLSFGAGILTILCQRAVGTIATFDAIPLPLRITNAVAAYGWYLQKLIWPIGLGAFYPHPALVDAAPWPKLMPTATASLIVLLAITILAVRYRREQPWLLLGWLWFLGVMVPMIGIMQVGEQQQADRYAYLPLIGLFLILACAGSALMRVSRRLRTVVASLACVALCGWTLLAYQQASIWRDSTTLFSHTIEVTERNHWAHNNLGLALLRQRKLLEAVAQFHQAILAVPSYALAHYNLGVALHELGHRDAARRELETSLRLDPTNSLAHQRLAALLIELGELPEAVAHFREAARLAPSDGQANFNLGLVLTKTKQTKEAIHWLTMASELQPNDTATARALALALHEDRQSALAISHLKRFLETHPDAAEVDRLLLELQHE